MPEENKNSPLKAALGCLGIFVVAAAVICVLADGLVGTKDDLRDDSGNYETYVIYERPDGNVVDARALGVRQDDATQTLQVDLESSALALPFGDVVVYRNKPHDMSRYDGQEEVTILMPGGDMLKMIGHARPAEKGLTNPGKYLLSAPFHIVETDHAEYYVPGGNLFVEKIR